MDEQDKHDTETHIDTPLRSSDGETYLGAKAVDEAVPSPTQLATETGFGTQTLPYQPLLETYGHHGTGMGSQSAQFASLPPVTGPPGSGNPGREGTGMGSLSWQMADANDLASREIVAVLLEDTAAVHKALINEIEPDHVTVFDHHREPAIELSMSAMSGGNEYHEDGTIKLDGVAHQEDHEEEDHPHEGDVLAHPAEPVEQETPHNEGEPIHVVHADFVEHADHVEHVDDQPH